MENEELDIQELLGLKEKPEPKKKDFEELYNSGSIHSLVDGSHKGTRLLIAGGKFILLKGSKIVFPSKNSLEKTHYDRNRRIIKKLIKEGKVAGGVASFILLEDLECTSSSAAASLVRGKRSSGLSLFEGVTEEHKMYNQNQSKNISKF